MTLQNRPGYLIKMRAKPDLGEKLFNLASTSMKKSGASDRYMIVREDDDQAVLWAIEIFNSDEAKVDYESSQLADELRDEIIDLLAEPPLRIAVHPYSASPE